MTGDEALALVRHAFRRDVWRSVDQAAFICRLHGVPDLRRIELYRQLYAGFRRELTAEYRGCENRYFELSDVLRPADRVAFYAYERPGAAIGHAVAFGRVDFS